MQLEGYDQMSPNAAADSGMSGDAAGEDQMMQGDGLRHHEVHEMPDGSAHSKHTAEDGSVEEKDHDSYEDACASCGGDGEDTGEDSEGDNEGPDYSSFGDEAAGPNLAKSYATSKTRH